MKKILSFLLVISMLSVNIAFAETTPDITTEDLEEIRSLIWQCRAKDKEPEYENATYHVLNWYVSNDFMGQDIQKMNDLTGEERTKLEQIIEFNRQKLYDMYTTTKAALESYVNTSATPKSVGQAYDFSSTSVDGGILKDKNGKAIFSVGYARNDSTNWEVEKLSEMGATNVVEERGIDHVYTTNVAKDWITWKYALGSSSYGYSKVVSGGNATIKVNKASAGDFYLEQEVNVESGSEYTLSFSVKGTNVGKTWINVYNAKTRGKPIKTKSFDSGTVGSSYSNISATFTPDTSLIAVEFYLEGAAEELFIDSASLKKTGTSANVLSNPDFTDDATSNINVIWLRPITQYLEQARKYNTMLSLLISPHRFPKISGSESNSDLYNLDPDNTEFIKFNINHPKAKEVVEDYLRTIGKMIRDDGNASYLSNIILSNESAFDVTNFANFYLSDYRKYLKEKAYSNDITKLNMNWGTNYSNFDQITSLKNWCGESGYNDYDTIKFNEKVFTEWHSWMADILKEYIPDVKINAKPMKYFDIKTVPYSQLGNKGADIEKFDTFSDISGCDAYSFKDSRNVDIDADTFAQKMMWYDFIYSLTGKPINDSEDHIISEYNDTYSDRIRNIVFADLWQGALHGRAIASVWNFSTHDYDNLYDSDGTNNYLFATRPDCVNELAKASLDLRRNSDIIEKLNNKQADVAILYSKSSQMHTLDNEVYVDDDTNPGTEYLRQLFYAYKGAITTGHKVGFVTEDNPNKMNAYQVVIVPSVKHINQKGFDALQTFIDNGGKVIIANDCFVYNEYHRIKARTLSGATTISANSAADYASEIRNNIDSYVEIKDASTGNYATDIDCSYVTDNGIVYISLLNLNETEKQYKIYLNGTEINSGKDLISGNKTSGNLTLSSYQPVLFKCAEKETCDVKNVYFSNNSGRINWEADDEAFYHGASIYSVLSNNILKLDNVTDFFYPGEANKTYEVVSLNGEKTVRVTAGNTETFTLTEVPIDADSTIRINVKNNLDSVAHGFVVMTETTQDDKIVKVSSVEMSAYGKTSRNVEFNVCNPDDSVTIKVFDTLYKKKVLSNTITIPEE